MVHFWNRTKIILGHRLVLELAILASFIAFSVNPGSLGDIMRICGAIMLLNMLLGKYHFSEITEGHIWLISILLVLLLINALPGAMIHSRSYRYFLAVPGMVLAVHCLSKQKMNLNPKTYISVYGYIFILSVFIQFMAFNIFIG